MAQQRRTALVRARRARSMTQEDLAELLQVGLRSVKRWESGESTPYLSTRPAIAEALGVSVTALEAMLSEPEPVLPQAPEVDLALAPTLTVPAEAGLRAGLPVPRHVTAADAAQLDNVVSHLEQLDHTIGGRSASRTMAFAQLDMALACLRETAMSLTVRTQWMRVAARLARLCGFSSADAGQHTDAERSFRVALSIAREAGDVDGWLNIVCGMIRKSLQIGDLRRATELLGMAEAGQRPKSPMSACMLHAVRARVYGALGDDVRVLESIDRAEDWFAAGPSDADPAWLWYYDEPQLRGDTGHGLYPIAMQGRLVDEAAGRLRDAVSLHRPANARSIAFSTAKLATLTVMWGLSDAGPLVKQAIVAAEPVRSARLDEDLHDLAGALRRSGAVHDPAPLMAIRALLDRER